MATLASMFLLLVVMGITIAVLVREPTVSRVEREGRREPLWQPPPVSRLLDRRRRTFLVSGIEGRIGPRHRRSYLVRAKCPAAAELLGQSWGLRVDRVDPA